MKRRLLRILIVILVISVFTLYFAFTTFFFSPLEEDYPYDLATLVPRDVEFYVSKAELHADFDPLPRPIFAEWLETSSRGTALQALPEYREAVSELDVQKLVGDARSELARLPLELELLDIFGGRDLALAGTFKGSDMAAADWAVYGRANWVGKLGVELLAFPDLLGLPDQGLTVQPFEQGVSLSGGGLARTLYVARIQDVVVVATSADLVAGAVELEVARGQNSLGLSAKYGDHVGSWAGDGDELEAYVDYDALADAMGWPGALPNPASPELPTALAGRLFQLGSIRELVSTVAFENGMTLRMHGKLSSERMSAFQKRLYRIRGFDRDRVIGPAQVGTMVPADAGMFVYLHANLADLIRQALEGAEEAVRTNLDDLVREVWGYQDAQPLIEELDAAFKSRLAVAVRDNDFPDDPDGPPHNEIAVPTWALVLWIEDQEKLDGIVARIQARPDVFGISGGERGPRGIWENTVDGGHTVIEYWSELIDGTGHLATLQLRDYFVLSNHHKLLGSMVKTYYEGGTRFPRLSEDPWFSSQVNAGLATANLVLWANPQAVATTTRALSSQGIQTSVVIDWRTERPRIEGEILRANYPGQRLDDLTTSELERYEELVQEAVDDFEGRMQTEQAPELLAGRQTRIEAMEAIRGLLIELSIDQKDFEIYARAAIPQEESSHGETSAQAPDAGL